MMFSKKTEKLFLANINYKREDVL